MKLRRNVSLRNFSTFRIGGRAEFFYEAKNIENLLEIVAFAQKKKIPYRILAGGSNIVFSDGKLKGLLIKVSDGRIAKEKNRFIVDAAVPLAKVVQMSIHSGLRGLETLSGIPGTVGGAIVGNAGAYGHSISEIVEKVEVYVPFSRNRSKGKGRWLTNRACQFSYRESVFKKKPYLLLRAVLRFKKGNPQLLKKISRDIIKLRLKKYKPGLKCPGSFFKNVLVKNISKKTLKKIDKSKIIEGKVPAGYLLEAVGAKGMRVGDIKIADFHGNLFINCGKGKASDVKRLARLLRGRVKRKFGINLEEEIRYF